MKLPSKSDFPVKEKNNYFQRQFLHSIYLFTLQYSTATWLLTYLKG